MDSPPPPQRGAHTGDHGQRRDEGDECASGRAQKKPVMVTFTPVACWEMH